MGVPARTVAPTRRVPGGHKRSRKFVVDELIFAQHGEPARQAQSAADVKVAAPGDVGLVIPDGSVEAGAALECVLPSGLAAAIVVLASAAARRRSRFGRTRIGEREVAGTGVGSGRIRCGRIAGAGKTLRLRNRNAQ